MNLSLPNMAIGGEFVTQRAEMTATQTTRRLGRDVKIPRSQTEGGKSSASPFALGICHRRMYSSLTRAEGNLLSHSCC